jgi:hypothetical protein
MLTPVEDEDQSSRRPTGVSVCVPGIAVDLVPSSRCKPTIASRGPLVKYPEGVKSSIVHFTASLGLIPWIQAERLHSTILLQKGLVK